MRWAATVMWVAASLSSGCLSESINGAQIRAAAFSDPAPQVTIHSAGGSRFQEIDIWVVWSGPATLRSNTGYAPCTDLNAVVAAFKKRKVSHRNELSETHALTCIEKRGDRTGRQLLTHTQGLAWWRAWDYR